MLLLNNIELRESSPTLFVSIKNLRFPKQQIFVTVKTDMTLAALGYKDNMTD